MTDFTHISAYTLGVYIRIIIRMYWCAIGEHDQAYCHPGQDPEADEDLLISLLEEHHNAWRTIRRRRLHPKVEFSLTPERLDWKRNAED